MVSACPNCAIVSADEINDPGLRLQPKVRRSLQILADGFGFGRVRSSAYLAGAVILAGLLRHVVHIYGGISPDAMRAGAITVVPIIVLALMLGAKRRGR
jgi:hypothetical protein